jgi:hypothetical protein
VTWPSLSDERKILSLVKLPVIAGFPSGPVAPSFKIGIISSSKSVHVPPAAYNLARIALIADSL